MIVGVKPWPSAGYYEYYDVPIESGETARRAAFRFAKRQKESDYNELVHQTTILTATKISNEMVDFLK